MTLRLLVVLTVVVGGLDLGSSQTPRRRVQLVPVDEAAQVPAFKAYRDALQAAVAARDADRVLAMMHPEISQGWDLLFRITKERLGGQEHQSWTALDKLLRLGGTFSKGLHRVRGEGQRQYATREFCAPYVWSAYPSRPFPKRLISEDEPWVVLGRRVAVRAKPPSDMRVLMRLDYDLVLPYSPADFHAGASKDWIGIVTPDKRLGYVASDLIRERFDYHACFGEFDGTWLMTDYGRGQ